MPAWQASNFTLEVAGNNEFNSHLGQEAITQRVLQWVSHA
jgi:hypothetical protein